MPGLSDFVRGTLAFLTNCALAMIALLVAALRLRPVIGALRCKVRYDRNSNECPDGRILLFLASALLAVICTYTFDGGGEAAVKVAQLAVGVASPSSLTVITACSIYFTCEWTIARATHRRIVPGRKGSRNRTVLRFLMAALILEIVIYVPFAFFIVKHFPPDWFELTGDPESFIGDLYDMALLSARIMVLVAPFTFLNIALNRSKALRPNEDTSRLLSILPLNLFAAIITASFLTRITYSPTPPTIVYLNCHAEKGADETEVIADGRFRNDSSLYWTPYTGFRINLLRKPIPEDPDGGVGVEAAALCCSPPGPNETPSVVLVGPRSEVAFRRHARFNNDEYDSKKITGCSLSTDEVGRSTLSRLLYPAPRGPELAWAEVTPSANREGYVVFNLPPPWANR